MTDKPQHDSFKLIAAVVIDRHGVRIFAPLADVDVLSLIGCAAEDPAEWNDVSLVWPRYRFHEENTEFANGLPICEADLDDAITMLADTDAWFALDLVTKRILAGGDAPELRLRGTPTSQEDPPTETIVLPPWWELRQHAAPAEIGGQRSTPIVIPNPRRDILWGSAMTRFFAGAMIDAIRDAIRDGETWIGEDWEGHPCGLPELTSHIHRDWLMTPCEELGGDIPRSCLHGGLDWIADLANGQSYRVYEGQDPIPIPQELSNYETAPLGRHEMILYFEACRDTIAAGWQWLIDDQRRIEDQWATRQLAVAMDAFLARWLQHPFEGGRPPAEIIRCDRVRIPLFDRGGDHIIDCDCPICQMMAEGMFGPSFCLFDGHQLELDGEFAFSMHVNFEDWEAEQCEWNEMHAQMEADRKDRQDEKASGDGDAGDGQFAPVWKSTFLSDEGL